MIGQPIFPRDRVTVVGVLNLTPDSFSDGGRFLAVADGGRGESVDLDAALAAAADLVAGGAHVLDVGGESTRPGSAEVSARREIARTASVVAALAERFPRTPVSIDTQKHEVARAALEAGAQLVNDVSGLRRDARLAEVAADAGATLIVGHLRGTPATMQAAPHFDDVLGEVASELEASLERARSAGLDDPRLVIDPGIGFGKRLEDNLQLIAHADWLRTRLGLPILIGASRKSFLGRLTGATDDASDREVASRAADAIAAFCGADGVRVHDARGAAHAVAVGRAIRDARRKELT